MASHYPRRDSPYYWINYKRHDGTWGQKSSGVRMDAPGSLRRIHQLVLEETAKEAEDDEEGVSAMFRHWVPGWMSYHYANELSRSRAFNSWAYLSMFLDHKGVQHPKEVSYSLAHEFMRWRMDPKNCKRTKLPAWNTALLEIRFLGAVMQEALKRGWVQANPCARLGLSKRAAKEKRAITREEEVEIFAELKRRGKAQWMSDAFLVAMRQGCRSKEVRVPMSQVDTKNMVVVFNTKGGRKHPAPLHKDLLPLVKAARKAKREFLVDSPERPASRWHKFFTGFGKGDLCFHCTRVTVVTRLCEAGFSESQTMAYVGHSSALVHAIYRKIRPVAVAKLGDVL